MRLNRVRRSVGCALMLALAACSAAPGRAQNIPGQVLPEQIHGVWLVGAKTVGAQELGNATRSTLQVTRVFSGPMTGPTLLGQKFEVISTNQPGSGPSAIVPPPAQGENGIWVVSRTNSGLKAQLGQRAYGLALPAREGVAANDFTSYESALQVGLAVEKVARLSRLEATERLKGYALNDVPEVSAWAVNSLGTLLDPDSQEAFLKPLLANTQVPLLGRLAADAQFLELQKSDWRQSPERQAVLAGWVGEPLDERSALALAVWLRDTESLTAEEKSKLGPALLNNDKLSEAARSAVKQVQQGS